MHRYYTKVGFRFVIFFTIITLLVFTLDLTTSRGFLGQGIYSIIFSVPILTVLEAILGFSTSLMDQNWILVLIESWLVYSIFFYILCLIITKITRKLQHHV